MVSVYTSCNRYVYRVDAGVSIPQIHLGNKRATGKKCSIVLSVTDALTVQTSSLHLLLLDEEACRNRTFHPIRVG